MNPTLNLSSNASFTRTICLVACSKTKAVAPTGIAAKDLYTGRLFRSARQWAEQNADAWYILSAEYGLIDPEAHILPYDKTLAKMRPAARTQWAQCVATRFMSFQDSPGRVRVVILAGKEYARFSEFVTGNGATCFTFETPLAGLALGKSQSRLNQMLSEASRPELPTDISGTRLDSRVDKGPVKEPVKEALVPAPRFILNPEQLGVMQQGEGIYRTIERDHGLRLTIVTVRDTRAKTATICYQRDGDEREYSFAETAPIEERRRVIGLLMESLLQDPEAVKALQANALRLRAQEARDSRADREGGSHAS